MNNKSNIFEELNKMKSLIYAKSGSIISEQNIDADINTIVKNIGSLSLSSDNEKAVVNTIINNSKTKQDFEDLLSQFKTKTGQDLSSQITKVLQPARDPDEIKQLTDHLRGLGITMRERKVNNRFVGYSFEGLNASAEDVTKVEEMWKNQKVSCVISQPNVKKETLSDGSTAYLIGPVRYYANGRKQLADGTMTNYNCSTEFGKKGPTSSQRFVVSSKSLGIQNPKMDVATLQTILNTLNQGGQGITESKNSVNEELNMMKYLLGYQRGKVISEQDVPAVATAAAPPPPATTPKDLIILIQTVLRDKFKQNLGPTDTDGKWGKFSQDALENALKTAGDVSRRRESETQQTTAQDNTIQQAVEKGRMEIPKTNNQPTLPGIQVPVKDIYTTLLNNKTLQTRDNGNKIVYKGADLPIAQRQELESKLQGMGYRVSRENNDIKQGDKIVFKKN